MLPLRSTKALVASLFATLGLLACTNGNDGAGGSGGGGNGGAGGKSAGPPPEEVECGECFPFETLPAELQAKARVMLLDALDHEALYSIMADIKPMSSGFASAQFPAADTSSTEVDEMRTILGAFHCTYKLTAGLQIYAQAFDGQKQAEALVFHRPRFAETVTQYADPFAALGIDAKTDALAAVDIVDADPTTKRFRAYGHLFGYPKHAVDFFVAAEESEAMTGMFVERDFLHIPTYDAPTNAFTYAVPKGHVENEDDHALAERAAPVLAAYKKTRPDYLGKGQGGVVELVRTVFRGANGRCSPNNAAAFVEMHGHDPMMCGVFGDPCANGVDCCSGDCHGDHCH